MLTMINVITAKNTVISPDFLVWKLCLPTKFHIKKSGEITAFLAVYHFICETGRKCDKVHVLKFQGRKKVFFLKGTLVKPRGKSPQHLTFNSLPSSNPISFT